MITDIENMSPKAKPSAWDARTMWFDQGIMIRRAVPIGEVHESWEHKAIEHGARWGHEWALVAWLAENDKRQEALFWHLDMLRKTTTLDIEEEIDLLPELAMQLLAVNL